MAEKGAPADVRVAAIAARQHGVVAIGQLRDAGLSDDAVSDRVRGGRLHRVHRGVYAVGHPGIGFPGRCKAAVIALDGAVLSHHSAAALWRILPQTPGPIDVSVGSRGGRRRRKDIRVHRPRSLPWEARTRRQGIPVTTPARTISDLRRIATPVIWRQAIRRAEALGLGIGQEAGGDRTRSELEYLFLRLCRHHGLPKPEVNARVGTRVADFLWRGPRLIVETDGYRFHRGRAAFESDRDRDLELRALGFEVIRLSYRQVTEEPRRIAEVLREALQAGRLIRGMAEKGAPD